MTISYLEMFCQSSKSKSMSPIWIRWRVSRSFCPLKGEMPDSKRYVMMPVDHRSEAKVAPSPFTISGATYLRGQTRVECTYVDLCDSTYLITGNDDWILLV